MYIAVILYYLGDNDKENIFFQIISVCDIEPQIQGQLYILNVIMSLLT
jgi:hypothetical protein